MGPYLIAAVRLSYDSQFWITEDTYVLRRQSRLNVAIFAGKGDKRLSDSGLPCSGLLLKKNVLLKIHSLTF